MEWEISALLAYGGSRSFVAEVVFPHCTCSTNSRWELTQLFLIPPLFCVLLSFGASLRKPGKPVIWALAALLLALSQLDVLPHGTGFQLEMDTMAWADWFRIPATAYRAFVGCLWAPALLMFMSRLIATERVVRRCSNSLAVLLLSWSLLQSIMAVAWSEYYFPFVPVHHWLAQHSFELTAGTLLMVGVLCLLHNRALGVIVFACAILASSVAYWPSAELGRGHEVAVPSAVSLSDSSEILAEPYRKFLPIIPAPSLAPSVMIPAFAMAAVLLVLAAEFRRTSKLLSISFFSLLPPALYVLAALNYNIFTFSSWSSFI